MYNVKSPHSHLTREIIVGSADLETPLAKRPSKIELAMKVEYIISPNKNDLKNSWLEIESCKRTSEGLPFQYRLWQGKPRIRSRSPVEQRLRDVKFRRARGKELDC